MYIVSGREKARVNVVVGRGQKIMRGKKREVERGQEIMRGNKESGQLGPC